jgi:hypothetical protein
MPSGKPRASLSMFVAIVICTQACTGRDRLPLLVATHKHVGEAERYILLLTLGLSAQA